MKASIGTSNYMSNCGGGNKVWTMPARLNYVRSAILTIYERVNEGSFNILQYLNNYKKMGDRMSGKMYKCELM